MAPAQAGKRAGRGAAARAAAPPPAREPRGRLLAILVAGTLVVTLIGIGISSYLAIENLQGKASACVGAHGCTAVQKSSYGKIAGVPVSVPGLALYVLMAAAAVAWLRDWRGLRDQVAVLGFYGALFGALFSGFLTYIEGWVLEAWCAWCMTSALLMTALLLAWLVNFVVTLRRRV